MNACDHKTEHVICACVLVQAISVCWMLPACVGKEQKLYKKGLIHYNGGAVRCLRNENTFPFPFSFTQCRNLHPDTKGLRAVTDFFKCF